MHSRIFSVRTGALAAFVAVVSGVGAGQARAQEITIAPQLRAGDAFQLELTRSRENSAQTHQNGQSRTVIDVRVVSAGPEGYVLDWVPGETVLDNRREEEPRGPLRGLSPRQCGHGVNAVRLSTGQE